MTGLDGYRERLDEARSRIDALDAQLIGLLRARLNAAAEIGRLRREQRLREVGEHDRGAQVLARYQEARIAVDGVRTVTLERIGLAVLAQSAELQHLILESERP